MNRLRYIIGWIKYKLSDMKIEERKGEIISDTAPKTKPAVYPDKCLTYNDWCERFKFSSRHYRDFPKHKFNGSVIYHVQLKTL